MTYLIFSFMALLVLVPLFWSLINQLKKPQKINNLIIKDAKKRNLELTEIAQPKIADWANNPFGNKIRISRSFFNAMPNNQEHYRILKTNSPEDIWWVKAIDGYKSKKIELDWKKQVD